MSLLWPDGTQSGLAAVWSSGTREQFDLTQWPNLPKFGMWHWFLTAHLTGREWSVGWCVCKLGPTHLPFPFRMDGCCGVSIPPLLGVAITIVSYGSHLQQMPLECTHTCIELAREVGMGIGWPTLQSRGWACSIFSFTRVLWSRLYFNLCALFLGKRCCLVLLANCFVHFPEVVNIIFITIFSSARAVKCCKRYSVLKNLAQFSSQVPMEKDSCHSPVVLFSVQGSRFQP